MDKKFFAGIIITALVFGGGAFYGGIKYGQKGRQNRFQQFRNGNMPDEVNRGARAGGGFVAGEIISKDDKNITVKLRDGGSKIIFYSSSTEIVKFASGTSSDIEVGNSIMVNGSANSDGSITA